MAAIMGYVGMIVRGPWFISFLALAMSVVALTANAKTPEHHGTSVGPAFPAIAVTDTMKIDFAKVLAEAIFRLAFQKMQDSDKAIFTGDLLMKVSRILLETSIRRPLTINGRQYDLLYNPMADLFIMAKYKADSKEVESWGLLSGTRVSEDFYNIADDKNIFDQYLKARPILFNSVARDLSGHPKFEDYFGQFLFFEPESKLVRANLVSYMKLIAIGTKDPCINFAKTYVKTTKVTFSGNPLPVNSKIYTSIGFKAPQGRALAFADEQTNRYFGFIIFDSDDTTSCKVKAVVTSGY